ncbi:N-acetylmuramoyl-L-alanine amidase [Aliiroseovarius sp. PTFE2010]|uniref:N-acetylmuramoyl-L-alanine amidase n=1 Tax=Aliiroseovarius sp. PTFE2010 TaxID=3417190 RepID=UPI003CEAC883
MPFNVEQHPSPNFGDRRGGATPSLIVLHYTAMQTAEDAIARLCDPHAEVSAHYVICPQGRITQLVDERHRAWHAGAGAWGDVTDVNSASIGIELANRGDHPFAEAQFAALEWLLPHIMDRWDITPRGVIGHSDVAPGRKADPGARFDWQRLARRGLAVWPAGGSAVKDTGEDMDAALKRAGYTADVDPDTRLAAFRLRFRPGGTGPADDVDRQLVAALLA